MNRNPVARNIVYSLAAVLLLAGCGPSSPEEKVARLRGMYSARLNGFIVEKQPEPEPEIYTDEAGEPLEPPAEAAAEAEVGEPAEAAMEPMEPATENIRLDILIQHDSPKILPGVTVDISMADAAGTEKGVWKVWFDTAKVPKANVTQYTHVLEDVPYEEGDGFFAEIRHPVPPEERGEYREFSSAG